jgi:hypothetical protein
VSLQTIAAEQALGQLERFSAIIDARSPGEYAQDHLPGALNWPTLDDAQRQQIGTDYKQINGFESMRKMFEGNRSQIASMMPNRGQGGGAPGAGGPGGPPGGRSRSEEDRNAWRKNMIDRTTPEERARYTEYRRAMEKRREERGLQPGGPR